MDGLKLSALLPDNLDQAGSRAVATLREREDVGCLKLAWDVVGRELEGALGRALDCDVIGVVAECWAQSRVLSDYADPQKHPRGERSVVELGAHDFSREVHPVVEVTVTGCPPVELRFTFALTGHFGGVQLIVADGRIRAGTLGEAWVSAQLSYAGVPLHGEAESKKIALSGEFALPDDGLKIPRLASWDP
jgi:hypothetical protein